MAFVILSKKANNCETVIYLKNCFSLIIVQNITFVAYVKTTDNFEHTTASQIFINMHLFLSFQMRTPLLLLATTLLLGTQAKPNGFYHSEASFHQSSASYRNNELQHQNEDDGFYSEQGDLERKTKPKVNSYNQHSEYVNPKLKTGEYNNQGIDSGLFANADSQYAGASNQYAYGGSSYRAGARSYGQAANLEELTQRLQADLSRQLQSAVSEQYSQSSAYTHSSSQMNQDLRRFEEELRANLTRKLQEALYEAYGQQAVRGPYSYSITRGGSDSRTANYNVEDLENLKRQLENNLVNQLQQEVRTKYEASESRSSSYASSNNQESVGSSRYRPIALSADSQVAGVKTARRPVVYYPTTRYPDEPRYPSSADQTRYPTNVDQTRYPSSVDQTRYPSSADHTRYPSSSDQTGAFSETSAYDASSSSNFASSSSVTYRLTDLVHEVQLELARVIDDLLAEEQRKNTELIETGVRPNYDQNFQFLRQALIRNISDRIEEKINRYYGTQIERGDQFYSVTAGGTAKNQPNYSRDYLDDLKQQIEDNLVEKLSYGIRQQASRYDEERQRYVETRRPSYGFTNSHSSSSASSFKSANQYGGTVSGVAPLNPDYHNTRRPNHYDTNPDSEVELTNIQQQLQGDLSRQLQHAIREQTKEYSTYATSGNVGSSSYQTALQQLSDELKRNLTEQLQRYLAERRSASYSLGSGSHASYNQQQLEDVTRRLQSNLLGQLQDGLRQSWSSQYSYSASGSYTRPTSYSSGVKGHAQSYTQYGAEDCDESGHYRGKREIVLRHRAEPNDLTQQLEDFGYYQQESDGLTQQQDAYGQRGNLEDLTQQQQQDDFYNSRPGFGATVPRKPSEKLQNSAELDDQQQQLEDVYGNLEVGSQLREKRTTEASIFQQQNEDDLTQQLQTEDLHGFGRRQQQPVYTRNPGFFQRKPQSGDLTQEQETEDIYGKLELATTRKPNGLTQQQQEVELVSGNLQLGSTETRRPESGDLTQQQQSEAVYPGSFRGTTRRPGGYLQRNPDAEDLTQQQETEDIYGNLGFGAGRTTRLPGSYSGDLTQQQQTEDVYGFGSSRPGYYQQPTQRKPASADLTQFGSIETTQKPGGYLQRNPDAEDLTQQQETEDIYGNLELGSRRTTRRPGYYHNFQQTESGGLTQQQQSEDVYAGNFEFGSRRTTQKPGVAADLTQQQETEEIYGNLGSGRTTRLPSSYQLHSADLTQQQETEDIYGNLQLGSGRSTTVKPRFYQHDLTQQQQTEDLYSLGAKKPTSDDLTQQQETEDIHGNFELASGSSQYRKTTTPKYHLQQEEEPQGVVPLSANQQPNGFSNLEIGSQTKPTDDSLTQQLEDGFEGFSQQAVGEPVGRQDGSPSYYPPGYQGQRSSPYSHTVQHAQQESIENPSEEAEDLVQKPVEKHTAYQVYDVSPQAEVREELQEQNSFDQQENGPQPQQQPGFWKRVGNKFTNAYGSVRDTAREVFG